MPETRSKNIKPRHKWAMIVLWVLAVLDCSSSKAHMSDPRKLTVRLEVKVCGTGMNVVDCPAVIIGDISGNRAVVID